MKSLFQLLLGATFIAACGSKVDPSANPTAPTDASPDDTQNNGDTPSTYDSPNGCPPKMPEGGTPCSLPEGTICDYDASKTPCGSATCTAGSWSIPIARSSGCSKPPGTEPCKALFDKTCKVAEDCAFGIRQTSCCGDEIAIGFNKSQMAAFDANEKICRATYPGCGCASMGLTTESGRGSGLLTPDDVVVVCKVGQCTSAPPLH